MSTGRLEYYMSQNYPVEIRGVPDGLGGGYSASIPYLGRWTFFAVGESVEEAISDLEEVKRVVFQELLNQGKAIPLAPPLAEEEVEEYSGRLLLRIPKDLHRDLAKRAEENGCSINQYVANALQKQVSGESCAEEAAGKVLRHFVKTTVEKQAGEDRYAIHPSAEASWETAFQERHRSDSFGRLPQ